MDKKTIIGLVIVAGILFGYTFYSSKQAEKYQRQQFVADSLDRAQYPEKYVTTVPVSEESIAVRDTLMSREEAQRTAHETALINNIGQSLFDARKGEEQTYTLENDVMKISVSTLGGKVANVELKDYKRYGGEDPLMFYDEGSSQFDLTFFMRRYNNDAQINTAEYFFETAQPHENVLAQGDDSKSLRMRLPVAPEEGAYVEYVYTVRPGEYMVDFDINFIGMEAWTQSMTYFNIDWKATSLQNEKGFKNENTYTTMAYKYPGDKKVEQLSASEGSKSEKISTKVEWVSFKQQFFSSIFIAEDSFADAAIKYDTYKPDYGKIKDFSASVGVPYTPEKDDYNFSFYFGPNKYSVMKDYDLKLEKVIPLGPAIVRWINTGFVIPVFDWLHKYIESYGIIILILTIMVKIVIFPLTYKSYRSSAKMRALKPEIDEINERYPNQEDAMKKQQATMELYKKMGVSPMGGCLPSLIQLPVLLAMFRFLPSSIELRGQRFLWAEDLSAYDSILDLPFKIPFYGDHISLFTLLMAVAMFFYSQITYKQTSAGSPQMAGMKFMTVYLMPIMMLCWFNSYASGLTYYYLVSQLITIIIMTCFRYFTNEDKLREQLQTNAAKINVKAASKSKSNWQRRYEEALKQQQEMQRQASARQTGGSTKAHTAKPQSTKNQPPKKRRK